MQIQITMKSDNKLLISEILSHYNIDINSKVGIVDDLDFIAIIMECEKKYDININYDECDTFYKLRFIDIHDIIMLIKGQGSCTNEIENWINDNYIFISKRRPGFYEPYLRNMKINEILND